MNCLFIPAPEAGHLLPTVPIARTLLAHGCHVQYLVSANYVGSLRRLGCEAHSYSGEPCCGPDLQPLYGQPMTGRRAWRKEWNSVRAGSPPSELLLSRVAEIATRNPVDLLIVDRHFYRKPAEMMERLRRSWRVAVLSTSILHYKEEMVLDEPSTLVLCPPEFLTPGVRQRFARVVYAEPSLDQGRSETPFPWASLDTGIPLVLCSFGSQTDRHASILSRVKLMYRVAQLLPSLQFVVATGQAYEKEVPEVTPSNVLCQTSIPLFALLARANLLITHGGLGSIKEAIYQGVPVICWPLCCDQPFNAECILAHQLGGTLVGEEVTAEAVAALIGSIMASREVRNELVAFQQTFREMEAHPIAATRLQELAEA